MSETLTSLSEDELDVFVQAALDFFRVTSGEEVEVGEASIAIASLPVLDYTGLIEVYGLEHGFAYLTATKAAMQRLMLVMMEDSSSEDLFADLIGEIISIIVSNTRRHFGSRLQVSVPKVYNKGRCFPEVETMGFILPLTFQKEQLILVLALYPGE